MVMLQSTRIYMLVKVISTSTYIPTHRLLISGDYFDIVTTPWAHHVLKIKCSRTLENAFLKCTYIVVWPKSLPCILPLRHFHMFFCVFSKYVHE